MSAARKSFKVRRGNAHLTVSPWTHAGGSLRWRYAWRADAAGVWRYRSFSTKQAAIDAAEDQLAQLERGPDPLAELNPARRRFLEAIARGVPAAEESKVLAFVAAMTKSAEIVGAVARFMAGRKSKAGEETPHLATVRNVLEAMAKHFAGKSVAEIHLPDLERWWTDRCARLAWKRSKDIRATLVQFWRWAHKEGIAGTDPVTVAERLPEIGGQHGERQILTLGQFRALEGAILPEWRAWLVLGCFAGLRPEEIVPGPSKKAAKRGLRCEEIDWQFGVIRIAPEVSKVGLPRVVPLSAACRAGLEWAGIEPGMTGPTTLANPSQSRELARLGKAVFGGAWPKDICRHSYGSYRNAILRNLGQVAEEMGTSISMLHRHYHNPQPEQSGIEWFAITPGKVLIRSDETEADKLFSDSPIAQSA